MVGAQGKRWCAFSIRPIKKYGAGNDCEFKYRGETFRVDAHGAAGHEEVFIIHLVDGEEMAEISIDRMTEENDTSAPIEAICVMLCDKLIAEESMDCADVSEGFAWVEGARVRDVLPSNTGEFAH